MRTKFVHVLLEEQWNKLGYKYLEALRRVRQCGKIPPRKPTALVSTDIDSILFSKAISARVGGLLLVLNLMGSLVHGRPQQLSATSDIGRRFRAPCRCHGPCASGAGSYGRPKLLMFYRCPGRFQI